MPDFLPGVARIRLGIERRYLELGGEIQYKSQVQKVLAGRDLPAEPHWATYLLIEVVDVATPLSYERYTGNWLGSSYKVAVDQKHHGDDDHGPGQDTARFAQLLHGRPLGRARRHRDAGTGVIVRMVLQNRKG